jgi:hypothetical protein
MPSKKKKENKKQSLAEKYNLGEPQEREKLSEEAKLYLAAIAEEHRHMLKMGELWIKSSTTRYKITT